MSVKLDFISFSCNITFIDHKIVWTTQNIPIRYSDDRHYQCTNLDAHYCQFELTRNQLINQYPNINPKNRRFEDIESDKKIIYTVKVDNPFEILFDEQLDIEFDNEFDLDSYNLSNVNIIKNKSTFGSVNQYKSKKYKKINCNVVHDYEDPPLINKYREVYCGDDSPKLLIIKNKNGNEINIYSNMYLAGCDVDEIIKSYNNQRQQYLNYALCNSLGKSVLSPLKMSLLWWLYSKIDNLCKMFLKEMVILSGKILNLNKLMNDDQLF